MSAQRPDPVLTVRDLTLRRGGDDLVRELNWEVSTGTIGWVIGENGSGKSTLLAALAGRIRPAAGQVRFRPPRSGARGPVRYHPAMQAPGEVRVRDWHRLVDALAPPGEPPSLVPPDLPGKRRLDQLSTGQRKRLELEALLRRPASCYLLDEPFGHLSDSASALLCQRLERLVERSGVVVATHRDPSRLPLDPEPVDVLHLEGTGRWRTASHGAAGAP